MATVDNVYIVLSFFMLATLFIGVSAIWGVLYDDAPELWDSSIGSSIRARGEQHDTNLDTILFMAYLGLHLGILGLVLLLRTHPIVYIGAILIVALLTMIAVPLSNAWETIDDDSELLASTLIAFPKTNYIMANFPKFEVIWGFLTIVVMLGTARMEGFV